MTSRETLVIALRALALGVLASASVLRDVLAQVAVAAEHAGNGRLIIVVDFEHARRAWCQVLPLQRLGVRHSLDLSEIGPEPVDLKIQNLGPGSHDEQRNQF